MITNNDPLPVYSSEYRYDYLSVWERDYYRGLDNEIHREDFALAISPFRQNAGSGNNIEGDPVALGDIRGRWNMLGLFYPSDPSNLSTADPCNLLPLVSLQLTNTISCPIIVPNANSTCCPSVTSVCNTTLSCPEIVTPADIDPTHKVGFFRLPMEYRKYGVRFQADVRLYCDLGLRVQFGAADITQTIEDFMDLTLTSSGTLLSGTCNEMDTGCIDSTSTCKKLIVENIMDQHKVLTDAIGVCIKDYHHTGFEDTIFSLFWQRTFPINDDCDGWPFFLFVPHLAFEAIAPTSHCVNPNDLLALPLGNNGHTGLGFSAGMDFDFINSIEFGLHASMTKWTSRCYKNVPVPTNENQFELYPFRANYKRTPGTNWTFSATVNAHYFLDRLSGFGQYEVVSHSQDHFCDLEKLPCSRTGAVPTKIFTEKMRNNSRFHVHVFNLGLTYDIAPHFALGFLWQAPLSRHNAFRSTTVMLSVIFRW